MAGLFRFRSAVAAAVIGLTMGCVPRPMVADGSLDLMGIWSSTPDSPDEGVSVPFPNYRLVVNAGYVLNPFGSDCTMAPSFKIQPAAPFIDQLVQRHWPLSWSGSLLDASTLVQEVDVACGARQVARLVPLSPDMVALSLDDGAALILHRQMLRPVGG